MTPAYAAFTDVPSTHPNYDAITYVQDHNIVEGYADGTYHPDQTINRAEFTKIIILANFARAELGACDPKKILHFSDINLSDWYVPYLCVAVKYHINGGYPDGTFRPAAMINFAEASKMILNASWQDGSAGPDTSGQDWFRPYVLVLGTDFRAIPLSITHFDQSITRGEMAEMIYRLKAEVTNKPSQTYENLK